MLCEQNWRTSHSALLVVRFWSWFCCLFDLIFLVFLFWFGFFYLFFLGGFFCSSHLWVLEYNFVPLSLEILLKTLIWRFLILPGSIQTGSPQSGSLICILPKLLSDDKDKPLAPNRTIPKELGGRKVCPSSHVIFFNSLILLITAHLCRAQSQYLLFQVSQELAALGWQVLFCFRRPLFCVA